MRNHTNQARADGYCHHVSARGFDQRADDRCEQPDVLQDAEEDDREDEHHDDLHHGTQALFEECREVFQPKSGDKRTDDRYQRHWD